MANCCFYSFVQICLWLTPVGVHSSVTFWGNHSLWPGADVIRWYPTFTECFNPSAPGFQLPSSHLLQIQQEACSASSPNLGAVGFLLLSSRPRSDNHRHADLAWKPQPCLPSLVFVLWTKGWYFKAFLRIPPPTALSAQPEGFSVLQLITIQCLNGGWCSPPLGTAASFPCWPSSSRIWQFAVDWALVLWLRKAWLPP